MAARRYPQFCSVARALDVIGDRWTLLVIRELLFGPRRYTDLLDGLSGIATDMLAGRLRDLERFGLLTRETLPPPAASRTYRLTPRGEALAPVVEALAAWGGRLPVEREDDDQFLVRWLLFPLRAMFLSELAVDQTMTVQFDVDGHLLRVAVEDGELVVVEGQTADPDVLVTGDAQALAEVFADATEAVRLAREGRLHLAGTAEAIRRFRAAFGLDTSTRRGARTASPADR